MITADYGALEFYQVRHADSNHLTWDLASSLYWLVMPSPLTTSSCLHCLSFTHLHVIIQKDQHEIYDIASLIIFCLKMVDKINYDLKNIITI